MLSNTKLSTFNEFCNNSGVWTCPIKPLHSIHHPVPATVCIYTNVQSDIIIIYPSLHGQSGPISVTLMIILRKSSQKQNVVIFGLVHKCKAKGYKEIIQPPGRPIRSFDMFNKLFGIFNELFDMFNCVWYHCHNGVVVSIDTDSYYNLFKSSQDFPAECLLLRSWLVELLIGRQKWTMRAEVRV